MCGGKNTTTSTQTPSTAAMSAYTNLLSQAGNVAATPYTPYTGEGVAPVNAQQYAGINNINANAEFALPYVQEAEGVAGAAAQPITASDIAAYENPFTQQVVGSTEQQFANTNAQQQQQVEGNAIAQGAFGGNREAVAQAETAGQQQIAEAPVIAGLESQGYTQGVNTALTEQQAAESGAANIGSLGVAGQSAALSGANAQVGAGTLEQQTQQALDQYNYQQYLNQMAYPFQTTQWLSGIDTGVGSQMGGTSTTTTPPPNYLSELGGLAMTGVGIAGGTGGFGATGYLNPNSANSIFSSDRRVKENIRKIGKLFDGQTIYRFNYKGDKTIRIGLVAQDVEKVHPHAVHEIGGIKAVDYDEATRDAIRRARGGVAGPAMLFLSDGGVVPHFALGGAPPAGISPSPYGFSGPPFGGSTGFVPSSQIVHGRGAPAPPRPAQQQQTNLNSQAKSVGELANSIRQGMNTKPAAPGAPLNIVPNGVAPPTLSGGNGAWSGPPSGVTTPQVVSAPAASDPLGSGPYRRGGVVGYADGGGDDFSDVTTVPSDDTAAPLPPEITQGQSGAPPALVNAVWGQESGNRDDVGVSSAGARGPGQVMPDTFDQYARPGEKIDNPEDNRAVSKRILDDYSKRYGDPARAAVAYYSGPGNVAPPDSPTPWIRDISHDKDGNPIKPVSSYVDDVMGRMRGGDRSTALAFSGEPGGGGIAPPAGVATAPGSPTGVAPPSGIDLSSGSKLWPSLISAGGAMMASHSPYLGVALGEGTLAGANTYEQQKREEQAANFSQQKINQEAQRLNEEMNYHQKELDVRTKPYTELTAAQKAELQQRQRAEQRQEMQPVKIGTDMSTGTDIYGVRDPATGGFRRIDPASGTLGPVISPQPHPGPTSEVPTTGPAPTASIETPTTAPVLSGGVAPPVAGQTPLPIPGGPATTTPPAVPSSAAQKATGPQYASAADTDAADVRPGIKPEVLDAVDPKVASQVKALDEGRMAFPTGFALKSPYWQNMLRLVAEYDPSFDAVNYNSRAKTRNDFVAGKSAQNITSFNTAIGHLGTLDQAVDGLNNTAFPLWNKVANWTAYESGNTDFQKAQKRFMDAKQAVTDELTRAFRGSGGNVHDIVGWEQTLNEADSPAALHAAVQGAVELLRSRIEAIGDQYNRGMGTSRDPLTLLSPHAQATIDRLSHAGEQPPATEKPPAATKPATVIQNGHTYTLQPDGSYK